MRNEMKWTVALLVVVAGFFAVFPSYASAYDWPVKPFHRQHAIRGTFDDPRISTRNIYTPGSGTMSFHFGVDIAVPDGTPVYAVKGGRVHIRRNRPTDVGVMSRSGGPKRRRVFGYWHIETVVKNRQLVHKHQLLGYVLRQGFEHVHFSEWLRGRYVNPLRRGGLAPYRDHRKPTIVSVSTWNGEYQPLGQVAVSGTVGLVVNAFDPPVIKTSWPIVLPPTVIRWKLIDEYGMVLRDKKPVDFHRFYTGLLTDVYAPRTLQNGPVQTGVYNFWLTEMLDTTQLEDGAYKLIVYVTDIRGNRSVKACRFVVSNEPAPVTSAANGSSPLDAPLVVSEPEYGAVVRRSAAAFPIEMQRRICSLQA